MRQLTKTVFATYVNNEVDRMWHTCKEYKDRDEARIELERDGDRFVCPICGFVAE